MRTLNQRGLTPSFNRGDLGYLCNSFLGGRKRIHQRLSGGDFTRQSNVAKEKEPGTFFRCIQRHDADAYLFPLRPIGIPFSPAERLSALVIHCSVFDLCGKAGSGCLPIDSV